MNFPDPHIHTQTDVTIRTNVPLLGPVCSTDVGRRSWKCPVTRKTGQSPDSNQTHMQSKEVFCNNLLACLESI